MEKKRRRKSRQLPIPLMIVVIIIAVILVAGLCIYKGGLGKVSNSSELKTVTIQQGTSTKNIAKQLKEEDLIKNPLCFLVYVKLNHVDNLHFGTYQLAENMGVAGVVAELEAGSGYDPEEFAITFPEGIHMREVAEIIAKNTNNSYDEVLAQANDAAYIEELKDTYWFITDDLDQEGIYYKLEGYLYPETYNVKNKDVSVREIFDVMLAEMDKQLAPYQNADYSQMSIHEYLALASMVEEESPAAEDRNKMSSVFRNRLEQHMSLGSDVTTRYACMLDDSEVLTVEHLQTDSPYNTRITNGTMNGKLPIGPICTVSADSIQAAFEPDDHAYLYFISNMQTRETFFYESYDDFLDKKEELKDVNQGL